MKKVAFKTQAVIVAMIVLWGGFAIAQAMIGQTRQDQDNIGQAQSQQGDGSGLLSANQRDSTGSVVGGGGQFQGSLPDVIVSPLQAANPGDGSPFLYASSDNARLQLQGEGPLQGAGSRQGAGPLFGIGPLLGIGPLSGLGPLQGVPPLISGGPIGAAGPIDINVQTPPLTAVPSALLVSVPQQALQPQVFGDPGAPATSGQPNSSGPQIRPEVSSPPGGSTATVDFAPNSIPTCAVGCGPPPPPPNNVPPLGNVPSPNNVPPQSNGTPS